MGKRKPSVRTARREGARAHEDLVRDLERLASLAPGGAPERPIVVEAPTQVESLADAAPCPLCEGTMHLVEHTAETHDRTRLRVAHLRCTSCGVARERYFRLGGRALH